MIPYEHKRVFDVRYCDVDFKDELKPSSVLVYFEEAAGSSAEELGFGYSRLKPAGYTFMLTNVRCRIYKPVPLGARIVVRTWPTPPSYVVFGREYKVESESFFPLVHGRSENRPFSAIQSSHRPGLFFL